MGHRAYFLYNRWRETFCQIIDKISKQETVLHGYIHFLNKCVEDQFRRDTDYEYNKTILWVIIACRTTELNLETLILNFMKAMNSVPRWHPMAPDVIGRLTGRFQLAWLHVLYLLIGNPPLLWGRKLQCSLLHLNKNMYKKEKKNWVSTATGTWVTAETCLKASG